MLSELCSSPSNNRITLSGILSQFSIENIHLFFNTFLLVVHDTYIIAAHITPGGYFQIRRSGGLDLTSGLEAKFGARSGQVHQIRRKIWEVQLPQDEKVGKSHNFGVISEIQRAKFGVFVTYNIGGKILGSNKNFRGIFRGQAPSSS